MCGMYEFLHVAREKLGVAVLHPMEENGLKIK